MGVLSGGRLAQEVHAGPSDGGGEASVRASCPIKPMCAPFLPLKAHSQPDGALISHHICSRAALAAEDRWKEWVFNKSLLEAPAVL